MTPTIMVATPMYGGLCTGQYTYSLLAFYSKMIEKKWQWDVKFIFNESLITRARDDLATLFLESTCSHLLFLDADIKFNPDDIVRMVEADKDIIGGCYPMKSIDWNQIVSCVNNGVPTQMLPVASATYVVHSVDPAEVVKLGSLDPVEVFQIGTGMMLIKREVFEKLKPHCPTYLNDNLGGHHMGKEVTQFFATSIDPVSKRLWSEDYHFCQEWRKIGGKVYAAPWALGVHIGTHSFGQPL